MHFRQRQPRILISMIVGMFALPGCSGGSAANPPSSPAPAAAGDAGGSEQLRPTGAAAVKPAIKPTAEQIAAWGIRSIEPLKLLACGDGFGDPAVLDMALAPDGKRFVLAGAKLTVWNTGASEPTVDMMSRYKHDEVERPLPAVAISADGKWLAAGDQKGRVRVWTLDDQTEVAAFSAHNGRIAELAFSPDSQRLATTSYAGDVNLWRLPEGKKLKTLKIGNREITRLLFLTDKLLAAAGGEASIWNVETGEKQTALTAKNAGGPALAVSSDAKLLAFNDADGVTQLWDVRDSKLTGRSLRAAAHLIAFSTDGKWVATYSQDSTIRIWDAETGRVVQVIDADGGRTSALAWLSGANALVIASELGRVRVWGTPEAAQALEFEPMILPELSSPPANAHRPLSSAALSRVVDVRAIPHLPGAAPQWSDFGMSTYTAPASQQEAEQYYRYCLGQAGWQEAARSANEQPGLTFRKQGCELNVSFSPAAAAPEGRAQDLQVTLVFAGNYDARWLPKFKPIESKSDWNSFSSVSYRTKADLTDVEVGLLKLLHDAGWTAYTRLAAAGTEDPRSRSISLLQGGNALTVTIGYPADSASELYVQTHIGVTNKSVPIPPDAGWIEFDSSTDLQFVINTGLDLQQTAKFYAEQMAAEGWLAREAGRQFKDDKAWLPYIRGQQDIFLRLAALPAGGTQIVAGDAASSSWQLNKPKRDREKTGHEKTDVVGIEAAEFQLPVGAAAVKFDVDQKNIEFEVAGTNPVKLGEQFAAQMEALGWKRDGAGIVSNEYVFITYTQGKAEIQLRTRPSGNKATAMINGNGLLWTKPLPTAPVRISYEAWLRRNNRRATLDLLDEFAAEMRKIPASGPGK